MEVREIIDLMKALSEHGLTKLELEQGDGKLVLKKGKDVRVVPVGVGGATSLAQNDTNQMSNFAWTNGFRIGGGISPAICDGNSTSKETQNIEDNILYTNTVDCPLVGTFYSASSPEADPFVRVGDCVKKGQVLGIVEAMKLMNEIESEYDGVVEAVLVENETTVEYGQPLFRIRPAAVSATS